MLVKEAQRFNAVPSQENPFAFSHLHFVVECHNHVLSYTAGLDDGELVSMFLCTCGFHSAEGPRGAKHHCDPHHAGMILQALEFMAAPDEKVISPSESRSLAMLVISSVGKGYGSMGMINRCRRVVADAGGGQLQVPK